MVHHSKEDIRLLDMLVHPTVISEGRTYND